MNMRSYIQTTYSEKESRDIREFVSLLKTLGSTSRFNILRLIFSENQHFCVGEIADSVGISHSAASHQLGKLEDMGIVSSHRIGQTICYHIKESRRAKLAAKVIKSF